MKVGFIGRGARGSAMAANLLQAGHDVTVYNRTRQRAEVLADRGAQIAESPGSASLGEVVITMLADDAAVEGVVLGSSGALASLGSGAIHVSMSTISVASSKRLAEAHAAAGQRYVAAPVFGRPDAAATGRLHIVGGGPAEALQAIAPLFEA